MEDTARRAEAEGLTIRLLGGFWVAIGGQLVTDSDWRLHQARTLVKLLALAPDRRLHREQVLDALWPDLDPVTAGRRLEQALHAARRALEPTGSRPSHYLRLAYDMLTLCAPGAIWVDVEAFETAATVAETRRDAAAYEAALALYTGDLLPEDAYEDWAVGRQEVLRQTHLGLLVGLAQQRETGGAAAVAISLLRQVVAREPAHEAAHRALMRLYAATGRRHDALRQYQLLVESLRQELAVEPEPATCQLYETIMAGQVDTLPDARHSVSPPDPRPDPPTNVPASLSSFVGREQDLGGLRALLPTTRLLTLTGAGGVGKTRLALEMARQVRADYPDGVWLVELAALAEAALVPQPVAAALGVRDAPGQPLIETLAAWLANKHLLLVLDNCEHLVDACARLAERLLRSCPDMRLLVTSREPLRITGETAWRVPSLAVPGVDQGLTPPELLRHAAVCLFVERARDARPGFAITEQNGAAVAQVCCRLDGIPLAIELAAARLNLLTVDQMAARLDDRFGLLTVGSRTALPRHQTLRATIDWSYSLLTNPEQALLRRLAVFAGGWTLSAAEEVCGETGKRDDATSPSLDIAPSPTVLDTLAHLVDKSLVLVEGETGGEARYRLLETVRQYALEKLDEVVTDEETVRRRHADWCLTMTALASASIGFADMVVWMNRSEVEHNNLRVAMAWCIDHAPADAVRLAEWLGPFWEMRLRANEGQYWLRRLLERLPEPTMLRAWALLRASGMAYKRTELAVARDMMEESLALGRHLGDQALIYQGTQELGYALFWLGDYARSRALLEEGLALARAGNDQYLLYNVLHYLGWLSYWQGAYASAWALLQESRAMLPPEVGLGAPPRYRLARLALTRGDTGQARALLTEALAIATAAGTPRKITVIHNYLGLTARWLGELDQAVSHFDRGRAVASDATDSYGLAINHFGLGTIASLRGDAVQARSLLEDGLARVERMGWQSGRAMLLHALGLAAWRAGNADDASARLRQSLTIRQMLGEPLGVAEDLESLALSADRGHAAWVVRLLAAAEAIRRRLGAPLPPVDQPEYDATVARTRTVLSETIFATAWAAGQSLTVEEAIADALAEPSDRTLAGPVQTPPPAKASPSPHH